MQRNISRRNFVAASGAIATAAAATSAVGTAIAGEAAAEMPVGPNVIWLAISGHDRALRRKNPYHLR